MLSVPGPVRQFLINILGRFGFTPGPIITFSLTFPQEIPGEIEEAIPEELRGTPIAAWTVGWARGICRMTRPDATEAEITECAKELVQRKLMVKK